MSLAFQLDIAFGFIFQYGTLFDLTTFADSAVFLIIEKLAGWLALLLHVLLELLISLLSVFPPVAQ